ncbi:MAG TPA: hypothetical protein VMV53_07990 [Acidimicrobiales bacterium]|nr:hypothetical protein [Acidimicrobiales bacterium]
MSDPRARRVHTRAKVIIGTLIGALIGLGVSSGTYALVNPVLERSSGLLRETQGLLWSSVPVLTALGAVLGRWMAKGRRGRR